MAGPEPEGHQVESLEIEDPEVFNVLNNPLRLRILRRLIDPRSIREVAESLDVPPTRLYYHFNMLEEAGVIRVVETRKVGAMLQKLYVTTAKSFRPSPRLVEGDHSPHELGKVGAAIVLDGARLDAEEALAEHFAKVKGGDVDAKMHGSISRTIAFFTPEEADRFVRKVEEFIKEEFDPSRRTEGVEYGFSCVFFPIAGSGA